MDALSDAVTIRPINASRISSFELAGCPSKLSGLKYETAGS
jgi:hypothetical protein